MNYYQAREIQRDGQHTGLFHYTCRNDDHIYPVGFCSPYRECEACHGQVTNPIGEPRPEDCAKCGGKGSLLLPLEQRCPGHPTPEAACEHYRQYLLSKVRFGVADRWPKYQCEAAGCEAEATHVAGIPLRSIYHRFCQPHCTLEELAKKLTVGEFISS